MAYLDDDYEVDDAVQNMDPSHSWADCLETVVASSVAAVVVVADDKN